MIFTGQPFLVVSSTLLHNYMDASGGGGGRILINRNSLGYIRRKWMGNLIFFVQNKPNDM